MIYFRFLRNQFRQIEEEARRAASTNGREICGLILKTDSFLELIQVRNKAKRSGGFAFYFGEVRAVAKKASLKGHEIVGTFHSHPVGLPKPGRLDLCSTLDDSLMLIFDVTGNAVRLWHIKDQKAQERSFTLISVRSRQQSSPKRIASNKLKFKD